MQANAYRSDLARTQAFNPVQLLVQAVELFQLAVVSLVVFVEDLQAAQVVLARQHATNVEGPITTRVIARPKL